MLKRILSLPYRILKKALGAVSDGGRNQPAPQRAAAAPRPRPVVRPEADGDDHGHSHDHGHDHSHAREPEPEPEPAHDHDHGHDHGHSHDHGAREVDVRFEPTPNPNAMKFIVNVKVSDKALSFNAASDDHPLAKQLFAIAGVASVFAVNDFVTVTKTEAASWGSLTHPIARALKEALVP